MLKNNVESHSDMENFLMVSMKIIKFYIDAVTQRHEQMIFKGWNYDTLFRAKREESNITKLSSESGALWRGRHTNHS